MYLAKVIGRFIIICMILSSSLAQFEGDACIYTSTGEPGVCAQLGSCTFAATKLKQGESPQICTFSGSEPIVCCVEEVSTITTVSSTKPPLTNTSSILITRAGSGDCPPLPTKALKVTKNGQKAWDKCIDLADTIFRCKNSLLLGGPREREELCSHFSESLIVGGVPAGINEFPHMALLGYGDLATAVWECGGTLISKRWVMTAAHCMFSRSAGTDVKYVRLGTPDVNSRIDRSKTYNVLRILEHPDRIPPQLYNDIGLLELDRDVSFGASVIPACLHVGSVNADKAVVTGWGVSASLGMQSNRLLKVTLDKFSHQECSLAHPPSSRSPGGVENATQICYGSRNGQKDSCQGDSGGPLQILNKNVFCTYTVIGVVSIGKGCAIKGIPGIYTRVAAYIPWIESVVWP